MRNWLKENWFKISVLILITIGIAVVYFQEHGSRSTTIIQEKELLERFNTYSDMVEVALCREAYDEFITNGSKERKGYDSFKAHCDYREENWSNFEIENIVFSGEIRADIKYSYDLSRSDLNSEEYEECLRFITTARFVDCGNIAPKKIERTSTIETWLFEDDKWKRDY